MEFLKDLKNGDIKSIILVILIIFMFHQYWRESRFMMKSQCKEEIKESMSNVSNDIKEVVKQVYLADVEAIRNLSEIATKINAGTFVFPGNLNVTGSFNYLPKGTIVAYNQTSAPAGWTLCDGQNGAPDLRGKFIFGNGGSRGMNSTGGAETVALREDQMPHHTHTANVNDPGHQHHMIEGMGIVYAGSSWYARDGGLGGAHPRTNVQKTGVTVNIDPKGGNQAHENMPPFYVLTYIMKL